jgi:high-affinity Fe2+/Pb2+ permease
MATADPLLTIHRANLVLGAASTCAAGLLWGGRGMLAAGLGATLAIANFWAIRRLGVRAVVRVMAGESPRQALVLVAGLTFKMALLCALVWFAIRRLDLPVLPFALGLSAFVFSILTVGLFSGLSLGANTADVTVTAPGAPFSAPPASGSQKA